MLIYISSRNFDSCIYIWYNTFIAIYWYYMIYLIIFTIKFIAGFIALFGISKIFSNDVTLKEVFIATALIEIWGLSRFLAWDMIGMIISIITSTIALIYFCRFEAGPAIWAGILYNIIQAFIIAPIIISIL